MAIPFNLPGERDVEEHHHYLRIENLLKELLTLIRWMPSWTSMMGGVQTDSSNNNNALADAVQRRRQHTARVGSTAAELHHRCRSFAAATRRPQQPQQQQQQQQQPQQQQQQQQSLPDLITSCTTPAAAAAAAPAQNSADPKSTKTVTLQVQLCHTCYHTGRKLKVVAVSQMPDRSPDHQDGFPDRSPDTDDEGPVVAVEDRSKVKRRLMSLLQPSKIDSSILTAVFVIIGWKMFIRQ